ncbi:MAG: hypothetical protein V3U26_00530 [Dehalococcoidia bacterium]
MSATIEPIQAFQQALSSELWQLVKRAGETGAAQGQPLYLVGGRVRGLLLGLGDGDMDLVVEGDALAVAQGLADEHGGEVVAHPRFGTAKYRQGDLTIDLATARSEVYPRPGALPQVRPGPIDADLTRRDFTINAMALHLSPPQIGRLLDPFNGRGDLEGGLIRILHPASFIDDATRIMRALRYEQRLGFRLEERTEELLLRDISYLETVGVDRLRHELELILREERPEPALARAHELGVLRQIHSSLRADDWLAQIYREARSSGAPPSIGLYLALLVYRLTPQDALDFLQRYRFTREQEQIVRDLHKLDSRRGSLEEPSLTPSGIYALLDGLSLDALEAFRLACGPGRAAQRVRLYLTDLRDVRPSLDGHQLKALGVAPGPEMGRLLKELRNARLDGRVRSEEEEVSLVQEWLRER